jgi:hypothetical protein
MSVTHEPLRPPASGKKGPRGPAPGGVELGRDNTRDARRIAAAVLEVLAGARTPTEAAGTLSLSVPRYYQIEARALRGLLAACEAQPRGPGRSLDKELAALQRDNQRLQRDLSRQQALMRAAARTVGLTPPPATPPSKPGKKIRKRRVARALSVATRLQQNGASPAPPTEAVAHPTAI